MQRNDSIASANDCLHDLIASSWLVIPIAFTHTRSGHFGGEFSGVQTVFVTPEQPPKLKQMGSGNIIRAHPQPHPPAWTSSLCFSTPAATGLGLS
jgi:hypothetical protein